MKKYNAKIDQTQVEVDITSPDYLTDEPADSGPNVLVSSPEKIEVRLVDARVLGEYELRFFLASLLGGVASNFVVASAQSSWDLTLLINGGIFVALFFIVFTSAVYKRRELKQNQKSIEYKATPVVRKMTSTGNRGSN